MASHWRPAWQAGNAGRLAGGGGGGGERRQRQAGAALWLAAAATVPALGVLSSKFPRQSGAALREELESSANTPRLGARAAELHECTHEGNGSAKWSEGKLPLPSPAFFPSTLLCHSSSQIDRLPVGTSAEPVPVPGGTASGRTCPGAPPLPRLPPPLPRGQRAGNAQPGECAAAERNSRMPGATPM